MTTSGQMRCTGWRSSSLEPVELGRATAAARAIPDAWPFARATALADVSRALAGAGRRQRATALAGEAAAAADVESEPRWRAQAFGAAAIAFAAAGRPDRTSAALEQASLAVARLPAGGPHGSQREGAWIALAEAAAEAGRIDTATDAVERAALARRLRAGEPARIADAGIDELGVMRVVRRILDAGHPEQALAAGSALPDDLRPWLHAKLAATHARRGRPEEEAAARAAARSALAALAQDPGSLTTWFRSGRELAGVLADEGRVEEALALIRAFPVGARDRADALAGMAELLTAAGSPGAGPVLAAALACAKDVPAGAPTDRAMALATVAVAFTGAGLAVPPVVLDAAAAAALAEADTGRRRSAVASVAQALSAASEPERLVQLVHAAWSRCADRSDLLKSVAPVVGLIEAHPELGAAMVASLIEVDFVLRQ